MIINDSLGFNIKTVFTTKFMLLIEIHQIFEFTIDNSNSLELVVCVCVCLFRDNTRQCNACGKIQRERDRAIWKFESCFCHALDSYNILLLLLFRIQSNFTCVSNHVIVIVIVHVDCWLWIANLKPSSHELMRNSSSNRNHNRVNQSRSTFDLCEITAPKTPQRLWFFAMYAECTNQNTWSINWRQDRNKREKHLHLYLIRSFAIHHRNCRYR